ncbi:MAG TPA: SMC-Scp complex subunit ScpB [Thermoplasmata archaeon]|nr:SMC-Scp complex subunit ScpB [Thermoplasmata archaeon]
MRMPAKVDDLVLRLEAILFAAGKPMSIRELTDATGAPDHRPVQAAIRKLEKTYAQRQTALEVRRAGDRYALQLRTDFLPAAHPVAAVEMAPRTVKALTLIAYHQPILQSALARMVGDTAYDEVGRLSALGLVHAEPKGATLLLKTTRSFAARFGLSSSRPDEIRRFLEEKMGVAPGPPPGAAIPDGTPRPEADGSGPPEEARTNGPVAPTGPRPDPSVA